MKKIILASATMALAFGVFSCSENFDIFPESMSKVYMIKDSGTQNVVIYSAQDEAKGSVTILKGGVAPDQAGTATLRALSEADYAELLEGGGISYSQLPASCYKIEGGDISFNGGEGYKQVNYTLDVKAIGAYLDNLPAGTLAPAIFMTLESNDGTVNKDNNSIVLVPDYRDLTLGFEGGDGEVSSSKSGNTITYTGTIALPIESLWDFTAEIGADASGLDELNNANYGVLSLMPEDAYEIVKQPTFTEGSKTAEFEVKVDASKASPLNVLPLTLKSSGLDGLDIEYGALASIDFKVALTEDMLSTNAQEPNEGPIRNVLDGNTGTFFHSAWSFSISDPHWVEITTPEKYTKFAFMWTGRNSSYNDTPAWMNFYVGTSDSNLKPIRYGNGAAYNGEECSYTWNDENPDKNFGENIRPGAAEMNIIAPAQSFDPSCVFRLENLRTWSNRGPYWCISTLTFFAL